jgi:hypothetical protein
MSVDIEHRVDQLERDMEVLKTDIQATLLAVHDSLERNPTGSSVSGWRKTAWGLALLNMLLAIALFANIRVYTLEDMPFDINPALNSWVRGFWLALACMWMVLQIYPLVLLLAQEEQRPRRVALSNVGTFLATNPGYAILVTLLVLIVAIVSAFFPALWYVIIVAFVAIVCNQAARHLLEIRQRARTGNQA